MMCMDLGTEHQHSEEVNRVVYRRLMLTVTDVADIVLNTHKTESRHSQVIVVDPY